MKSYSELEIVIQRDAQDHFQVSARQRVNEGDAITPFMRIALDPADPVLRNPDPHVVGTAMSNALFAVAELNSLFVAARKDATVRRVPLRIRIRIDPGAAILHSLAWETMVDPVDPTVQLLRDAQVVFSRYLFTRAFRLPLLRPSQGIRALLVVADPHGLSDDFAAIDVEAEIGVARRALTPIPARTLGQTEPATLDGLMAGLSDNIDILYLVCHGTVGPNGAALWLQDNRGRADLVTGEQFAARINALDRPPSLIVLCSCQSAGVGHPGRDALTALGPMLAREGVPAVLAMQGNLSMDTAATFMPAFFKQLAEHGEVDLATAVARSRVMANPDWWMPVVFTRLDSARIWYPPGFGVSGASSDPWQSIIGNLKAAACTPILGPAMSENLFGARADLAKLWGQIYRYPMSDRDTDDLPRVAQYLAVTREGVFPRREFFKSVYRRILDRFKEDVPPNLRNLDDSDIIEQLGTVVSAAGAALRRRDPDEPHRVLAAYRLPVYITTDPSNLLIDALVEQGAKPRVRLVRWNGAAAQCDDDHVANAPPESPTKATRDYPIVVKLFGDLASPASLVLTEDQFFDYLTKAPTIKDIVPPAVKSRLSDSALLFLGFDVDSWEFRVMYRSLLQLEGVNLLLDYEHFAVQIDPNSILDLNNARRYIEKYLQLKAKLRLYWGDVAAFISELSQRDK